MNDIVRKLKGCLEIFVRITTGIVFVAAVFITIFWGKDCELGVKILFQILIVGAICSLGSLILPDWDGKEVSKKALIIRKIVYYIFVNVVVLGCGFYFEWFYFSRWEMVAGMEAAIAAVFFVVTMCCYWSDTKTAEKMNKRLMERDRKK